MKSYEQYRPEFKFGDLLQWSGASLLSEGIKLKTENDRPEYEKQHSINVNHSSLLIRFPLYEGPEDRVWTTEAVGSGTALHLLSVVIQNYSGKLWWYPLKDDVGTDDYRKEIGILAFKYIGIPYAYDLLIEQLVKSPILGTKRLFCSEYCQLCYKGEGEIGRIALNPNQMPTLGIFKEPKLIFDSTSNGQ
ncbi:MAG: hypothetical protein L7F77_05425 [Candidatus Magnetominusculus sp. LBB02]|nr:hypothetical protein [Candidatus Magnetominusculus sp. LBB02]